MRQLASILLFCFMAKSCALRLFHMGRMKSGNLGAPATNVHDLPDDQWFLQLLDHFDPTNTVTWKQRYFTNDTFYVPGGPVFLMIGGEGEASPKWMVSGTWLSYAKKFNALCFQLEHRYYGKSHPTNDLSAKNLVYLSSEQALADIAHFITSMTETLYVDPNIKWIVFGGSYPGSLAAWMRLKYPHLVHGAVSTSGPLLAVSDFKEYYRVVEESLYAYNPICVDSVILANSELQSLMAHRVGQRSVAQLFKLCEPIDPTNTKDISNFYESLASNFAGVVQYNKDNRDFEGTKGVPITIDIVCDTMLNASLGSTIDRIAKVNEMLLAKSNESCLDYKYQKMISEIRSTNWDSETAEGGRQWTYQTCTEFGFFQTSTLNETKSLFGNEFPNDFFIQQCSDIFGKRFNKNLLESGIQRTNMLYGALNIQADNVVYVHGSVDPWHALGITQSLRKGAPSIYINGTAHCANMYPSSPNDPPQLVAARNKIEIIIGSWLAEIKP